MRALSAGMQTAVAAQRGTILYFLQISSSGGETYLSTAPVDIDWNSLTWQGVGGHLVFGAIDETPDTDGQGVDLALSGVDQSIIGLLLTNNVRGRPIRIWLAHLDDGDVIDTPEMIFRGHQLADYSIRERRAREGGGVEVKTRVESRLAVLRYATPVHTNPVSHNDMLKRAGLPTGDTFFQHAPNLAGRSIRWGPVQIGPTSPSLFDRLRNFRNRR